MRLVCDVTHVGIRFSGLAVLARSRACALTSDTFQFQREATGGPKWLTTTAYAILAAIVATWLALTWWALRRAEPERPRREPTPRGAVPAAA